MNQSSHYSNMSGKEISLNYLSSSDMGLMRERLNMFADVFDDFDSYCSDQPDDRYLKSLLERDNFIALVVTVSGQVIGGLAAYELHKFEQQRSEIYIYDLGVKEAYRRKGIATSLINELQKEACCRGAYVIFVQADQGDEPAIQLYQKLGLREDVLHFDIKPDR